MTADGQHLVQGVAADIDPQPLLRLLQIASPEDGRELLLRLTADLGTAADALAAGLDTGDKAGLRAQSHVLIALAGAVGGTTLTTAARALNAAAHDPVAPVPSDLVLAVIAGVGALRAHVAAQSAPGPAA